MAKSDSKHCRPVLIIPGFMSSGLAVQKSIHKSWEGKRLWLNISSAGFNSLHVGGALRKNEQLRSTRDLPAGDSFDQSSEEMHQEYVKQIECKSRWLWHIRLQPDMMREKEGVEVRPVPGTAGVDYLAPGALTETMSYVFGPVLKLLKAKGYTEGVDLDAAPYDWRIPPSVLESRDKYFTNTMKTIERLYSKSNNKRVVLLCHSMGCKTGHYLLNFALYQLGKTDGQAWIDRHIHSYVPVGAPHIGAQKTIRAIIDGDKMGLDVFLDKDEGLMLGRSLGSAPWLFPVESSDGLDSTMAPPQSPTETTLPQPLPIPTVILRHESSLQISIPAQKIDLKSFVHNRKRMPPTKLRLAIQIGNDVLLRTDFVPVTKEGRGRSSLHVNFNDGTWLIACPPTIQQTLKRFPYIQLHLEEPGSTGTAPKQHRGIFHIDILWAFRCLCCLIEWIFCCPCTVLWKLGCCVIRGAKKGADIGAALLGESRVIGHSSSVDWKKGLLKTNGDAEGGGTLYDICTNIQPTGDVRFGFFLAKAMPQTFNIKVKWESNKFTSAASTIVCHQRRKNVTNRNAHDKQKDILYNSCNKNVELLQMEGLKNAIHLLKETYGNDPLGPLSLSAWQPPPINKVIAIYGINLDTEIAGVYKRNPSVQMSSSGERQSVKQLFVLDKEATLNKNHSDTYVMEDGVIRETKKTPQKMIGGGIEQISGDGTVPYWSLQHCRAWRGKCDVKIHELDQAEHRAILNDKRFHKILLDLLEIMSE
ncbi:hypothetical protein ACHAXR_007599 [Thalassiosira sp. AJA248-18]